MGRAEDVRLRSIETFKMMRSEVLELEKLCRMAGGKDAIDMAGYLVERKFALEGAIALLQSQTWVDADADR